MPAPQESVVDDESAPGLDAAGGETAGGDGKSKKEAREQQAAEEWLKLYKLLFQPNFFAPLASPSAERKAHTQKTLGEIVQSYPKFSAKPDRIILTNRSGAIHVQAARIEFVKPRLRIVGSSKFTEEAALTMARLASQNETMLNKGVVLRGSPAEQQMLLKAIEIVNAEMPAGMKLAIRRPEEPNATNNLPVEPAPQPIEGKLFEPVLPRAPTGDGVYGDSPVTGGFDDEAVKPTGAIRPGYPETIPTTMPPIDAQTAASIAARAVQAPKAEQVPAADILSEVSGDWDNYVGGETALAPVPDSAETVVKTSRKRRPPSAVGADKAKRTRRGKAVDAAAPLAVSELVEKSEPIDATLTQPAAPVVPVAEKIDTARRGLLTLGVRSPVDEVVKTEDAPPEQEVSLPGNEIAEEGDAPASKQPRKFTRRFIGIGVFAAAVLLPTTAAAEGLLSRLGFKKSKTYDRQKAGAGLGNKTLVSRPETAREKKARLMQEAAEAKKGKKKPQTEQDKKDIKKWNAAARKVESTTKIARGNVKPKAKASEEALEANKARKKGLFAFLFAGAAAKPVSNDNKAKPKKGELSNLFADKAKKGGVYLYHRHTGEKYFLDFSRIGTARCQTEMNRFLRDHYSGAVAKMDPRLCNYLRDVSINLGTDRIDIVSGYRTRHTNINVLGNKSAGKSQHCLAKALDIAVSGCSAKKIFRAAEKAGVDGIGLYAAKSYVHIDCRGHDARW